MTDIIYMVFGLAFGAGLGWLIAKVQTTVEKRRSAAPKKNLPEDRSLASKCKLCGKTKKVYEQT